MAHGCTGYSPVGFLESSPKYSVKLPDVKWLECSFRILTVLKLASNVSLYPYRIRLVDNDISVCRCHVMRVRVGTIPAVPHRRDSRSRPIRKKTG